MSGLFVAQVDEADKGLCAAFNAEAAVERGMIVLGLPPVSLCVEVVIGCAVAVGHFDVGFGFCFATLFALHDAPDALGKRGVDKEVETVGMLAQNVVGAAAHDDTWSGVGHLADDVALGKEHLVGQRHRLGQEAVILIAQYAGYAVFQLFDDFGGKTRDGCRKFSHVLVVKRNVIVVGQCLSYFAAARSVLAADGDDLFHGMFF